MTLRTWMARTLLQSMHALLVWLPAEGAHTLFTWACTTPGFKHMLFVLFQWARPKKTSHAPLTLGTLHLDNRLGIAAGFDKYGKLIEALHTLGFGFIEIGTVTPLPQTGNPKPRVQKFHTAQAMVNAMGMNNPGIQPIHQRLDHLPTSLKQKVIVSISKNKDTSDWIQDLKTCMSAVWHHCGGLSINVSSPNTPGLRSLQAPEHLQAIDKLYSQLQKDLGPTHLYPEKSCHPLLLCKLSPDLSLTELDTCLDVLLTSHFGAVILTNTTTHRTSPLPPTRIHGGGWSGAPLKRLTDACIAKAAQKLQGKLPLIAVGGICSSQDAQHKLDLGATALQIYTGFVLKGPRLLWDILEAETTTTTSPHTHTESRYV